MLLVIIRRSLSAVKLVLGKNDKKGDNRLAMFISVYLLASSSNMAVKTIFSVSSSLWSAISLGFQALIFVFLIYAFPVLIYRTKEKFIVAELVFATMYCFSYLMGFADNTLLLSSGFWTLGVCIPLALSAMAISDKSILLHFLKTVSFIEYPILCVALISIKSAGTYSMSVSYALLLPIIIFIYDYSENSKIITLLLAIFGIALTVFFGARGPILCIAFYTFVKLFLQRDTSRKTSKILLRILIIVTFAILLINWDRILSMLDYFLSSNGINSYTLRRLLNGQITETSGRDDLWAYYLDLIKKRPLLGYGVLGGWKSAGEGPHNMLLEFILAFGVVVGSLVSIMAIVILIRAIKRNSTIFDEIVLIFAAVNFTLYSISGDWLEKPLFFVFAALAMTNKNTMRSVNTFKRGTSYEVVSKR